jgi:tripartite-type tricarboxylate transporter receptor subunit TctC
MRLRASSLLRHAALLAALALATLCLPAQSQSRATGPITFVVPFSAGGSADAFVRLLAEESSKILDVPVVVDNKPGASAIIGTQYVAHAPADGKTVLFGSNSSMVNNIALFDQLPYDPVKDFAPVVLIGQQPMLMVVRNELPVRNVAELVEYARKNPGKLNRASAGQGNISNLGALRLESQQQISTLHVPFTGDTPALTALLGGNVDMYLGSGTVLRQNAAAGKIRGLAVMGAQRYYDIPDVPTLREAGFNDADAIAWYALVVRSGTPPGDIDRLNKTINQVLSKPEVVAKVRALGIEATGGTQKEAARFIEQDRARWVPLLRAAGIKG